MYKFLDNLIQLRFHRYYEKDYRYNIIKFELDELNTDIKYKIKNPYLNFIINYNSNIEIKKIAKYSIIIE